MRTFRKLTVGWTVLILGTATPASADWPPWVERLLFNPTERTTRGIERHSQEAAGDASEPLETALRLSGDDPVAQYNAGTARLAGQGDAQALLEAAAEQGTGALVPAANYNLGNARLNGGDLPGAIEAFKSALRSDPGFEDAKFNLELAQRLLEQQQQDQQDQENQDQQDQDQENQDQQDQDQENQDQQDQDQQDQDQENQDQQDQDQQEQQEQQEQQDQEQQDQEQQPGEQSEPQQPNQQQQQERPLPQFEDLPDMTAEEAAAILEAIENMEREHRREEALEAAKKHSGAKKDW